MLTGPSRRYERTRPLARQIGRDERCSRRMGWPTHDGGLDRMIERARRGAKSTCSAVYCRHPAIISSKLESTSFSIHTDACGARSARGSCHTPEPPWRFPSDRGDVGRPNSPMIVALGHRSLTVRIAPADADGARLCLPLFAHCDTPVRVAETALSRRLRKRRP